MDSMDEALPKEEGGDNTIALFLGLYLLILAFFILLVSISSLEEVRTQQIMDSLSSTFTTILPPSTELTPFQEDEGQVIAGQAFQERVTGIFATSLQIAKVDVVQPGRLMKVSMPVSSLFDKDKAQMRNVQLEMLDRIVATVSAAPAGVRFDLEFVMGSNFVSGSKKLPVGETLELARTGAFAREMLARGVPPSSVSVGINHSDPTQATLWFHTRETADAMLRFEHLMPKEEDNADPDAPTAPEPTGGSSATGGENAQDAAQDQPQGAAPEMPSAPVGDGVIPLSPEPLGRLGTTSTDGLQVLPSRNQSLPALNPGSPAVPSGPEAPNDVEVPNDTAGTITLPPSTGSNTEDAETTEGQQSLPPVVAPSAPQPLPPAQTGVSGSSSGILLPPRPQAR